MIGPNDLKLSGFRGQLPRGKNLTVLKNCLTSWCVSPIVQKLSSADECYEKLKIDYLKIL